MSNWNNDEIIDLTSSDHYVPCKIPNIICSDVIDLSNESFDGQTNSYPNKWRTQESVKTPAVTQTWRSNTIHNLNSTISSNGHHGKYNAQDTKKPIDKDIDKSAKPGLCSICWDRLGRKPLASTKCGHVYCLVCLEKSLKCNKRCPTCRRILKGASAYHPLYIELG